MLKKCVLLILAGLLVAGISCKNPLKDEQKKEKILELVNDYIPQSGFYVFFWDGKDKNKEYIDPGEYIVLLEIKSWQDQEMITAQGGGKPGKNDNSHYEPGYWLYHDLLEPEPNPFQIESGVNIPVRLKEAAWIVIRIYKN